MCTGNAEGGILRDLRFRNAYKRALRKQRVAGTITPQEQRRYWLAAVTMEKFAYNERTAYFVEHLQFACEKAARESGDFLDDLSDWWNRIVSWIMENWEVILQLLLSLLVFLETPENG